jgi:uncharacterized protein (DUF1684 family)
MKISLFLVFLLFTSYSTAQHGDEESWMSWRMEKDSVFADSVASPLLSEHRTDFNGLKYFDYNPYYAVLAFFEVNMGEPFSMPTTTERTPLYRVYGYLHFTLLDSMFSLPVYQNLELKNKPGYADYLFLPFTDLTNAEETYGGGRYIDLKIMEGNQWKIDFNKSYNPYCAYNSRYSCPIPPIENHLNIRVEAGVLKFEKEY